MVVHYVNPNGVKCIKIKNMIITALFVIFIYLTRNYKTKEKSTVDSIKLEFPELTWVNY